MVMKYIFLLLLGGFVIFFIFSPKAQQLVKSVWLITQTSPYQQAGTGAGLVVVVGDSTAYGTGVKDSKESVAGRIGADYPDYEVLTLAENGRVIRGVTEVLTRADFARPADVLLLQIGGNDILRGRTKEEIENDTRVMLTEAKKHATHVVFISCGNVGTADFYVKNGQPDTYWTDRTLMAREIYQRIANELQVTYVDLYVPSDQDPFLLSPQKYFSNDGLHPSGAGYGLWYESLSPVLRSFLTR